MASTALTRHPQPPTDGARARAGTVSGSWLAERLEDPRLRILDVRAEDRFAEGHLPGAVLLDVRSALFDEEGSLVGALELARVMSTLGVGDEHTVVLVGDGPTLSATAALRVFVRYGHADVHILDGGYTRWVADRRAVTRAITSHPRASFTARVAAGAGT